MAENRFEVCLRCTDARSSGDLERAPFRRLSKPYMLARGTYVKRASAALMTVDYHQLPELTKREDLHVGDEVYIMDIVGEVRLAKVDDVNGDEARASDAGMVFLLEFGSAWVCPSTVLREVWEGWQKGTRLP